MSVAFSIPGKAVSKSNYRHSKNTKDHWKRIIDYQQEIGLSAIAAGAKRHLGTGKVYVRILLVNQPIDPDGIFKVALDGLKRVAFPDDSAKWVRGCQVVACEDAGPVRADYRIEWEEARP